MKKINRKAWLLLMLLLLGSMLLASCTVPPNGNGTQPPATEGETAPPTHDTRPKLVDAGESEWVVVYPQNAGYMVEQAVSRFITNVEEQTGVKLQKKTDLLRTGTKHDPEKPEILFGYTNYDETAAVLSWLETDQYSICQEGKKLLFAAHTEANVVAAVTYYIGNLLEPNVQKDANGKATLYFEGYTLPSASGGRLSFNGNGIKEYSIIYDTDRTGYKEIAELLRDNIKTVTGHTLKVYADTAQAEGKCEILIGETDRTLSGTLYNERNPKLMTRELVVSGDKLQILCGGPYSARDCVAAFDLSILRGKTEAYTNGSYIAENLAPNTAARTAGTDLRIMTANVLAARWGEEDPSEKPSNPLASAVAQRAEILAATLANYAPDAVGLQETDQRWLEILPQYLQILKEDYSLEYTWLFQDHFEGKANLTSVLYRSDKFTAVASECEDFSYWPSSNAYHMRVLEWVQLRSKSDATREFILLNTHWAHGGEKQEWRDASVTEHIALLNELKSKDLPIFSTGDYNSAVIDANDPEKVTSPQKLMTATGCVDLTTEAREAGALVNESDGCAPVGSQRTTASYIDHIFAFADCDVLCYETILGNRVIWLSDHAPQFADIRLN